MKTFKELIETFDEITPEDSDDFDINDIIAVIHNLTQDELNEVGMCIMDLVDPDKDENSEDENEDENSITERKYFDTKQRTINRNKKLDVTARRKAAKERKRYYKKNKSKLKRKNKLYRKKIKRNPNIQKKHR